MGKMIVASLMVLLVISAFMATSTSGAAAPNATETIEASTNATGSFGAFVEDFGPSEESTEEIIDGVDRDKPEQNMTTRI